MERMGKIKCGLGFYLILLLAVLGLSCSKAVSPEAKEATKKTSALPIVVVTNYPLQFMAQQIGGDAIDLRYPVPKDHDPAYWRPEGDTVSLMQQAELILINGAGHEPWLDTITLDEEKLLDTSKLFQSQYIVVKDALVHSHGTEGKHSHEGVSFTVWLDPQLALQQAQAIDSALAKLIPARAKEFSKNFEALKEKLATLDATLDAFSAAYKQQPVIASHPVYQYLQRRCNLNLESVHWEPGENPDDAAWANFDEILTRHPAKWMIWEAEPTAETRAKLEQRGVTTIVIEPCGNTPENGDFLKVMGDNFERMLSINAPAQ